MGEGGPVALALRCLLTLEIAALVAAVGAVLAFLAMVLLGELAGWDNQQGAVAMGAVAGAAPLGAVVGGLLGLWLGWQVTASVSVAVAGGIGLPVLAAAAGVGLWLWQPWVPPPAPHPDDAYRIVGPRPVVHFEVRLDRVRTEEPFPAYWHPLLRTRVPTHYVHWEDEAGRVEDGVTVFRMRTQLEYRHAGRALELRWRFPPEGAFIFDLGLDEVPAATPDFGPWRRVDRVIEAGAESPAPPGLQVYARWRVTDDPNWTRQ